MPVYIYKARKEPKKIIIGEINAEDLSSAISRLKKINIFPFFIEKKGEEVLGASSFLFFRKINFGDINIFLRQLYNLLYSGLPLANALDTLSRQTNNRYLRSIIVDLESRIKKGETFYSALSVYPAVFPPFFVNMARAGEVGGALDDTLKRLVEAREREQDLRSQLKGALAYPLLLVIISILTIFVLLTFVVPNFIEMFEELGQILPLPTRILLGISSFFSKFWFFIIMGGILIGIFLKKYASAPKGALFLDKIKLKLPVLGEVLRQIEISKFARTFGTLMKNGMPVLESLKVTSEALDNKIFINETRRFFKGVEKGRRLSLVMKEGSLFPAAVTDLLAVGEESAQFEQILINISDTFEKEAQSRIKIFMSVLEPILILMLGIIVAFIVVSMLLPIFEISTLLQ